MPAEVIPSLRDAARSPPRPGCQPSGERCPAPAAPPALGTDPLPERDESLRPWDKSSQQPRQPTQTSHLARSLRRVS